MSAAASAAAAPFAPLGQTPNQVAVGQSLDSLAGAPSAGRAAMFGAIEGVPDTAAKADALGQLSPQNYSMLPKLTIQAMDARDRMLQQYLVERRSIAIDGGQEVPGDFNIFLTGDVRGARYDAAPDRPRVKSDSRSIAAGIDIAPRNDVILGVMVGIDGTDARLDRQRPRITQFAAHIGPYASINNGRVYFDANAAYTYTDYKLRRQVSFGGFTDRLSSSSDSDGFQISAETGYLLRFRNIRFQPFAGIHYRKADVAGMVETGGAAALRVASFKTKSVQSSVGARFSGTVSAGDWAIRPTVQADWRRELRSRPDSRIEARFIDNDLATFSLKPTRLQRDAATVAAGVTATYKSRTAVRVAYNGEITSDRKIHALVLSVTRKF